ncbi:hypothetical protein ZIOFF_049712 [Zingiber officinale]|uniref:RING-type E3 ubiquitin transferase n=1 Tax=Zingiber officinale TaxID=94328 RepID=A0A8J5FZA4_ZINOF|nr:hypothetical protein ZIOFF_049712 [Zingiber officinale]
MAMSLGRRTASGILFTPSGLSFTFTEKSSTGERSHDRRRRRRRLTDTNSSCKTCKQATRNPEEESTAARCPRANVGDCTPRKPKTQSHTASERTPLGAARRKLPKNALQNSEPPAIDVPWEDDDVVDETENRWYIYDPYRDMRMDIDDMSYEELLDLGERIGTVSTAEEFVEGDELGEVACGHVYHATCIEQWLKSKNWCPLCKGSASPSSA